MLPFSEDPTPQERRRLTVFVADRPTRPIASGFWAAEPTAYGLPARPRVQGAGRGFNVDFEA